MAGGDTFDRSEVDSIYVYEAERFVVSLIVGYHGTEEPGGVKNAKQAAAAALALTRDGGSGGTHWFVFDRKTRKMHMYEQSTFEEIHVP